MNDRYDYCYECTAHGDDYYTDDDGNLKRYCPECPRNPLIGMWRGVNRNENQSN